MNQTPTFDLIVIGGGPAGVTAALRGRELGATVALIERGRYGRDVHQRRLRADARPGARGSPDEQRRPVRRLWHDRADGRSWISSSCWRAPRPSSTRSTRRSSSSPIWRRRARRSTRTWGAARFVDAHTVALPDGRQMRADKFILAAGGRARRLDFPGEELALIHSDIWRAAKLPRSVAVVGGAATGCQLAAIFNAFGSRVTVLDVAPHILTAEDSLVAQAMTDAFERRGIDLMAGINGVERIERTDKGLALVYKRGGGMGTVIAEAVVLSTGWLGNLAGLNLAAAGVETDGRYVLADHTCAPPRRTSTRPATSTAA